MFADVRTTKRERSKRLIRALMPIALRKRVALVIQRQPWISAPRRRWWSVELVRDLAENDLDAFHRFLWANHLGYADTYEVAQRFGPDNMRESRRMFFADLRAHLGEQAARIRSVLEVGCSLGYQLRHLETEVFPSATELEGIDIDEHAIAAGAAYLRAVGSKVSVKTADIDDVEGIAGRKRYDLVICTGVLMYLNEERAARAVVHLLRRTKGMLALAGLAHPTTDNGRLDRSEMRDRDMTFIHNLDRMITEAGGRIVWRQWEGSRIVDGNTIYFLFARPDQVAGAD